MSRWGRKAPTGLRKGNPMTEAQFLPMIIQGGFTVLAAFLVWRLVKQSERDNAAALARESRMADRLDASHDSLLEIANKAVKAQEAQNNVQRENVQAIHSLAEALNLRPCMLKPESGRQVEVGAK